MSFAGLVDIADGKALALLGIFNFFLLENLLFLFSKIFSV
jgi:hypothetical protein